MELSRDGLPSGVSSSRLAARPGWCARSRVRRHRTPPEEAARGRRPQSAEKPLVPTGMLRSPAPLKSTTTYSGVTSVTRPIPQRSRVTRSPTAKPAVDGGACSSRTKGLVDRARPGGRRRGSTPPVSALLAAGNTEAVSGQAQRPAAPPKDDPAAEHPASRAPGRMPASVHRHEEQRSRVRPMRIPGLTRRPDVTTPSRSARARICACCRPLGHVGDAPDRAFARYGHSRANEEAVRSSTKTSGVPARAQIVNGPPRADCAFCSAVIRHVHHVPVGRVRVGQDYGDAE